MSLEREVLAFLADKDRRFPEAPNQLAFLALGIPMQEGDKYCSIKGPLQFNACLLMLHRIPDLKKMFPRVAAVSRTWKNIIDAWDEIEAVFLEEAGWDWSRQSPDGASRTLEMISKLQ